jgi:hypothetical protein
MAVTGLQLLDRSRTLAPGAGLRIDNQAHGAQSCTVQVAQAALIVVAHDQLERSELGNRRGEACAHRRKISRVRHRMRLRSSPAPRGDQSFLSSERHFRRVITPAEQGYGLWVKPFIHIPGIRHPAEMAKPAESTHFLKRLAVKNSVSTSTQNHSALSISLSLCPEGTMYQIRRISCGSEARTPQLMRINPIVVRPQRWQVSQRIHRHG